MPFTNEAQIKRQLLSDLKKVADYVADKILEQNKEKINEIVYAAYTNPTTYNRTYEFREAWEKDSSLNYAQSKATGSMTYNPKGMKTVIPADDTEEHMGVHHGIGSPYEDSREYLASIIYEGISSGKSHIYGTGAYSSSRNAWKALDKWLGKKNLANLISDGFRHYGIPFKRNVTVAIQKN